MSAEAVASNAARPPQPAAGLSSARFIAAPLVGQSDPAWRMLLRRHGAHIVYTAMIEADKFVADEAYRKEMFVTCASDRPLIVQFASNDAGTFCSAAELVAPYCDGVDLNLGCPQRAARTGLYGSWLLDEVHHDRVCGMLRAFKARLPQLALTVKIRLLPTLQQTRQFCAALRSCGIDVLAVHGRTRGCVEERRKGPADLAQIRQIVQDMHASAPLTAAQGSQANPPALLPPLIVWGNGNVREPADVEANIAYTTADGYMVGEALLNDPTLFERCQSATGGDAADGTSLASAATSAAVAATAASPSSAPLNLTLAELRRKIAIVEEYIQMLQHPAHAYYSPFSGEQENPAASSSAADLSSASASATLTAASSSSFLSGSVVSDHEFRTPLVSFASFLAHIYRLLNGDGRARFLAHAQLTDELLDCVDLASLRGVMAELDTRIAAGRAFDTQLQIHIEQQKAARQAARASAQKRREEAATGVRTLNSKQRKRARWQQRKADSKRLKDAEGEVATVPSNDAASSTPLAASTPAAAASPTTALVPESEHLTPPPPRPPHFLLAARAPMSVRVLYFARSRELLGRSHQDITLASVAESEAAKEAAAAAAASTAASTAAVSASVPAVASVPTTADAAPASAAAVSVRMFLAHLLLLHPALTSLLPCAMLALNQEFVAPESEQLLRAGDELAFIQPISGG